MNKLDLQDKKVAILGVGIEGIALAKFLSGKASQIVFLDKADEDEILGRLKDGERVETADLLSRFKLISGDEYLNNLSDYDIILRSPGVRLNQEKLQEAAKNGVTISSQIKLFFDLCPCKIIGVTGTKGKGTTASLIFEILKKNIKNNVFLAGNIGYPAITLIPELKDDDIVILELSSFQLMDLKRSPQIAVVTNLSEDHLDYHKDLSEYREAKFNILKYQTESDTAVLNDDSTFETAKLGEVKSSVKYFSKDKGADAAVEKNDGLSEVILDPSGRKIKICSQNQTKLYGVHNLENIAAATLVADIFNIPPEKITKSAEEFVGLPHRLELVAEIDDVKYINDSYATNPDPTMAAIDSFPEDKILILGGSSKGANFEQLAKKVSNSNVKGVVLIDPEGTKIKDALFASGYTGKLIEGSNNIDEIIENASSEAKPREVIIFSPACASFGMFKNYKDRGEKFKTAVLNLIPKS